MHLIASGAHPPPSPGRIIWLFPAEERFVEEAEEAEAALQAMDASWQGAAGPLEEAEPPPQQAQQGAQQGQLGQQLPSPRQPQQQPAQQQQLPQQHGEVSMEEAVEAVESGRRHSAAETGAARGQTVVCEAARVPFERILLMPDCLNDHLPDKYLNALQQL